MSYTFFEGYRGDDEPMGGEGMGDVFPRVEKGRIYRRRTASDRESFRDGPTIGEGNGEKES